VQTRHTPGCSADHRSNRHQNTRTDVPVPGVRLDPRSTAAGVRPDCVRSGPENLMRQTGAVWNRPPPRPAYGGRLLSCRGGNPGPRRRGQL
jgi:hypothetical protein